MTNDYRQLTIGNFPKRNCQWSIVNSHLSFKIPQEVCVIHKGVKIESPSGKLGVLIPGLGAVSTTFIAGVEAIKKKIAQPIGSLTQLGTIRLGKRTQRRGAKIRDFVPLRSLEGLVFGGWGIYEVNCLVVASKARV